MVWLRTGCEITFDVSTPTPLVLMLRPLSGAHQRVVDETFTLRPRVPVVEYLDNFGNLSRRLIAPPGEFSIRSSSDVLTLEDIDVSPGAPFVEVQDLPDALLTYLHPSRYCESDRFIDLSRELVDGIKPGYDQVARVEEWVRTSVRYEPIAGNFQMSAVEVNQQRAGVCRELAHLGIALCRSLCIPARMVVGYLHGLEPMDFHAWFEAYVGGRWHTFDATQNAPRGGRVTIGYGRDAADVAIFNQFGPALYPRMMEVRTERLDALPSGQ